MFDIVYRALIGLIKVVVYLKFNGAAPMLRVVCSERMSSWQIFDIAPSVLAGGLHPVLILIICGFIYPFFHTSALLGA